jgi:hypothetical protein
LSATVAEAPSGYGDEDAASEASRLLAQAA